MFKTRSALESSITAVQTGFAMMMPRRRLGDTTVQRLLIAVMLAPLFVPGFMPLDPLQSISVTFGLVGVVAFGIDLDRVRHPWVWLFLSIVVAGFSLLILIFAFTPLGDA